MSKSRHSFLLYDLLSLKTAQAKVAYYLLCHADNNSKIEISMSQKKILQAY